MKMSAPAPSAMAVTRITRMMSRTMPEMLSPPSWFWISRRSLNVMRLPTTINTVDITVITPRPPIWISTRITSWPNSENVVDVSAITRPVTHTEDVAVKSESRKERLLPDRVETGRQSSAVPRRIKSRKPETTICSGRSFSFESNVFIRSPCPAL